VVKKGGKNMKLVYGHTDSIYVQMPMEQTEEILALLNNHVRKEFPNLLGLEEHPIVLEHEKYFQSLGVGTTKNRNAGLINWKDGKYLDEPEFVMTGFVAKRVAITEIEKFIQMKVLRMWVEKTPESEVTTFLKTWYNKVISGDIELQKLTNRSRYKPEKLTFKCYNCNKQSTSKELVELEIDYCTKCGSEKTLTTLEGKRPSISQGTEGLLWYNQQSFSEEIEDSYLYVRVSDIPTRPRYKNPVTGEWKRPRYVSAPTKKLLEEIATTPDYHHYGNALVKKAEPIYRAMGWDLDKVKFDINQKTLDEWW